MVHKKFENPVSTKQSTFIDRTPHPAARNYLDEMAPINGFHEENVDSIRLRESFRDEVSKRMGELLLKGQTMLDEYCPTCSGILMEDRTGVRRCVTCELFQEKTASLIVAEIPLQEEDLEEAVNEPPVQHSVPVEKTVPRKVVVPKPAPSAPVAKKSKKVTSSTKECNQSEAIEAARNAVIRKLEWATSKLDSAEDVDSVSDFLSLIQKSAETLQSLQI
ncbi:hypothetical protein L5515_003750 [Caenorhabditis briggsae]|uniref:Uncharacterized protein n=1 Tax=Caenorhabditis briggsae TaxID=6238 RepID=A0AAE9EFK4_CAEBR|nr:hypothetical protein L5515_003750 [Caenorhabditis briggsae]